jgi:hypothetical protein
VYVALIELDPLELIWPVDALVLSSAGSPLRLTEFELGNVGLVTTLEELDATLMAWLAFVAVIASARKHREPRIEL